MVFQVEKLLKMPDVSKTVLSDSFFLLEAKAIFLPMSLCVHLFVVLAKCLIKPWMDCNEPEEDNNDFCLLNLE